MRNIKDDEFVRGDVPITKQEVRAVSIGKLQLEEDSILIDVGGGTGSVTVEAAGYLRSGKVYSIERNPEACNLIRGNAEKFNCSNVVVIEGKAPEDIPEIPYTRMFVGGTAGSMEKILEHFIKFSLPESKVVINAICLETLTSAMESLKKLNFKEIEISQIVVSRGKNVGKYTMMIGENPIYVISAVKGDLENE